MAQPHEVTVTIDVTKEFIRSGTVRECRACPVALAIRSAVPFASDAKAMPSHLSIWIGEEARKFHYIAVTPRVFEALMTSFDLGRKVKPCSATVTFQRVS